MNNGGDIAWASVLIIILAQEIKDSYFIAHLKTIETILNTSG